MFLFGNSKEKLVDCVESRFRVEWALLYGFDVRKG